MVSHMENISTALIRRAAASIVRRASPASRGAPSIFVRGASPASIVSASTSIATTRTATIATTATPSVCAGSRPWTSNVAGHLPSIEHCPVHFVRSILRPTLITECDKSKPSFLAAAVSRKVNVFNVAELAKALANVTFVARKSKIAQENLASFSVITSHRIAWPDRASFPSSVR